MDDEDASISGTVVANAHEMDVVLSKRHGRAIIARETELPGGTPLKGA